MGETMAETIRDQIEIEKPRVSETGFKESISFGRFENDLLSWEKWSSFSQNKYLEEVGKCSTPGSVAKKKAYFEAHYKKIAARKAEIMDQEQDMADGSIRSGTQSNGKPISNGCGTKLEFDTLDACGFGSTESANYAVPVAYTTRMEEPNQDAVGVNCQGPFFNSAIREEVGDLPDSLKSNGFEGAVFDRDENKCCESENQSEELFELSKEYNDSIELSAQSDKVDVLVQGGNDLIGSQNPVKHSHQLDDETCKAEENKGEDTQSSYQKEPQKRIPASKDKNLAKTKKKSVAPTAKTTHGSLQRASKPVPASPIKSVSRVTTRKESSPSSLKKSSPTAVKKKTSTPNSLHMSLSLEPTNSNVATPTTTRRSFIMEKMGDKDIVKRAFRAFQNNFSLSKPSTEENSSISQQASTKKTAGVASTSITPQKGKERVKKAVENTGSQRRSVTTKANSVSSSRPVKEAGQHQTNSKASPSSSGLANVERAEKRKELSKKSNAKVVEKPHMLSQSKEKKQPRIKKLSESLNSKTTQLPEQRVSKTRGNKVGASDERSHKPDSGS